MNPGQYQIILHNTTDKNMTVELLTNKPIPEGIEIELWRGNERLSYETLNGCLIKRGYAAIVVHNVPKSNHKKKEIRLKYSDLYGREWIIPCWRMVALSHHYIGHCAYLLKVKAGGYSYFTFTIVSYER